MPMLDLSFVMLDPMLTSTFDVTRRAEAVGSNGRATLAPTLFPGQIGVITPVDPDKLDRGADGQSQTRSINVRTRFLLQDQSLGKQPDLITYDGAVYEVKVAKPWKYGAGWYMATASTIAAQDPPNT